MLVWCAAGLALVFYGFIIVSLVLLKWIDPFTTSVQAERRIESFFQNPSYRKQYSFVPLSRISPAFQHAVIAAEDARFYQHHGFDWKQVAIATSDDFGGNTCAALPPSISSLPKICFLQLHGRSFGKESKPASCRSKKSFSENSASWSFI